METKLLLKQRGICVIIPTYNNETTIATVVAQAMAHCDDVLVVNDGSTDATTSILHDTPGITLIEYARNRGKGYALKTAFARAKQLGFSYAITMDADGQHLASDIPLLLQANREHPGALIVGKRDLEGVDRSRGSSFANKFSNFWFFVQTGTYLQDTQTGYRLYPIKKLHPMCLVPSRYEAELMLMVFASWHGVKLVSTPIHVYYPPREERVSHFRPMKDFGRITILNCILCLLAVVYGLPLRLWRWLMVVLRTAYSLFFFSFFSIFITTPLVWLYLKVGRMTEKKRYTLHKIINYIARFINSWHGIPGVKFRSQVDPAIDFDKPQVFVCNHQSHLDLMPILQLHPKVVFLTNDWVYYNPFYGFIIRQAEYLPATSGIDHLLPQIESLIARGYSIATFPEGTRSRDCKIGRFHQGAFYIAHKFGLDVTPLFLYGPGRILPKKTYHLNRGIIYLEAHKSITQHQLAEMGDLKSQARAVRNYYVKHYDEIKNKIEQDA